MKLLQKVRPTVFETQCSLAFHPVSNTRGVCFAIVIVWFHGNGNETGNGERLGGNGRLTDSFFQIS